MAYKFQKGAAYLAGTVTIDDQDFISSGDITARQLAADDTTGSGNLTVGGTLSADNALKHAVPVVAGAAIKVPNSTGTAELAMVVTSTSNLVCQATLLNNNNQFNHKFGASDDTNKANQGGAEFAGFYRQQTANVLKAHISGSTGASKFVSMTVLGAAGSTVAGDVTVTGNLTVNGTLINLQTNNFFLDDDIASIGATSSTTLADNIGTGFRVADSGDSGGSIHYVNDGTHGRAIQFGNNNNSTPINVKADKFYGDATAVTGITATLSDYSAVINKADGDTLAAGINYIATIGGSGITVDLPAVASLALGTVYMVKDMSGTCAANKTITIDPNASELADGSAASIVLKSPFAAVGFMVLEKTGGNAGWSMF